MAFPPVPESPTPNRQLPLPSKSTGTPRVGMHLYQNDDDDDVSVLTFHTLGTHHIRSGSGDSSLFVKQARESLERFMMESKNSGEEDDEDCKSLSRISEEGGSQVSSTYSSKRGCCDRSKASSSAKSTEKETIIDEEEESDRDDDDTISLAESLIDNANKVLSSIGSSPYYSGRTPNSGKKLPPSHESPSPTPNAKHPSPMKQVQQPIKSNVTDDDRSASSNEVYSKMKKAFASEKAKKLIISDKDLEVSSSFLTSYFSDENTKPSAAPHNSNHGSICSRNTASQYSTRNKVTSISCNDEHIQKLESETKQLQSLLKERQLESKRASQSLGSSISRANALLDRLSASRRM